MHQCAMLLVATSVAILAVAAVTAGEANSITDARLHAKRGTNTRFELARYASLEDWQAHAKQVREQILTGCGLNPMPRKTPLKARVFGKIDKGDYTIENVHFQSYPGLYVVGNLYRPKGKQGPFPAVLNPHGHGEHGRIHDDEQMSIPARCANFAKLGMIAFAYSMIGYNENKQIDHRFVPSKRQELWGISPGGLQLWNSIRAVEFLQSLPDVDPKRIGCTGQSGGGTQTFMLSAVDDRIAVNAPVCMISATMQGGCVCENSPLARIDSNSVEIGCLMAPRPMFMVGATGDWTNQTRESEYPATQAIYRLYGAEDKVGMYFQDAGHNYNKNSREHVYSWFQRYFLRQQVDGVTPEQPHGIDDTSQLMAWGEMPKDALNLDQLTEELIRMHKVQLDGFGLASRSSLERYRQAFAPALRRCFAVEVPEAADITATFGTPSDCGDCLVTEVVIGRKGVGDAIPGLYVTPKFEGYGKRALMVHPKGKAALLSGGAPGEDVRSMLRDGHAVLAIDCFLTGDADKNDERLKEQFFTSFYRTDAAERVQDIVTALTYLRSLGSDDPTLIGLGASGIECLFGRAFAGGSGATIVNVAGFDATDDKTFEDKLFVPAIRRAGDVRTAAAMIAPSRLWIRNAGAGFPSDWIRKAYLAAGAADKLKITK